jgi:hypothetical protein
MGSHNYLKPKIPSGIPEHFQQVGNIKLINLDRIKLRKNKKDFLSLFKR